MSVVHGKILHHGLQFVRVQEAVAVHVEQLHAQPHPHVQPRRQPGAIPEPRRAQARGVGRYGQPLLASMTTGVHTNKHKP